MSQLIEVRLFRDENRTHWEAMPVFSYLPVVITGDAMAANIAKRLAVNFFKPDPTITAIRWNIKGESTGTWVEKETL